MPSTTNNRERVYINLLTSTLNICRVTLYNLIHLYGTSNSHSQWIRAHRGEILVIVWGDIVLHDVEGLDHVVAVWHDDEVIYI